MRQTAAALGIKLESLVTNSSKRKIKFHGKRGPGEYVVQHRQAARDAVRAELRRQIEQAGVEAAETPRYKPGALEW